MSGKTIVFICLLVIVLAVTGGGLWFLFNPSPVIEVPEGKQVISMDTHSVMGGRRSQLRIYENGSVIFHEDKGMRPPPPPGASATRTWRMGKINPEELDNLIDFIESVRFDELESFYEHLSVTSGAGTMSDLYFTFSVNSSNIINTVQTIGYHPPGSVHPDKELPSPLDEIYIKLYDIIENRTEEVYQESIRS